MIKVAVAEDHNMLVDGIRSYLSKEPDILLVGATSNGRDLCALVAAKKPDVVVTDIRMPVMDGITATRQLLGMYPYLKIVALTMFDQDEAIAQMIAAGAKGYVLKNSSLSHLTDVIRSIWAGKLCYSPNNGVDGSRQRDKGLLSGRQVQILKLVALGRTNQEIADQLFIGKTTVETHRKNMIRILNLKGTGELLRYALETKYTF
jgi:two-component system response regulator NreC